MTKKLGVCMTIVFTVAGLACLSAGFLVRSTYQPHRNGIQTIATVTGTDEEQGDVGGHNAATNPTYSAEFTFTTTEGNVIEVKDSCSTNWEPEVGQKLRVSYRPSNPEEARNLDSDCKLLTWMCFGIGSVFAFGPALGILARYLYIRKKYKQGHGDSYGVDELRSSEL